MIQILLIAIGLLGILAAVIFDIKKRIVPNSLIIIILSLGLIVRSFFGWNYLIQGLIFTTIFALIGFFFFRRKSFGGGDGKLLLALGVIIPMGEYFLVSFVQSIIFLLIFFCLGAMYGAILNNKKCEKSINTKTLKEGDWLAEGLSVNGRIIKKTWDGITTEELVLIQDTQKEVLIDRGFPFTIPFLLSFAFYILLII